MPSIKKRLKKLTSSKKSKSTNDLDQIRAGESTDGIDKTDDTCSYISEAASEITDASMMTNESSYSYASASGGEKKKRRLKLRFSSKKKKEKLVKDPSGNVIFRSVSVEHDPRGTGLHTTKEDDDLRPESVELSRSVGSNIGREECENSDADGWRMSGLMESVDRSSNHSLSSGKDNLISTFEDRRKTLTKPDFESTPVKHGDGAEDQDSQVDKTDGDDGKITVTRPVHIIQVEFTNSEKTHADTEENQSKKELLKEEEDNASDDSDELMAFKRELEPVEEEDIVETIGADQEHEFDIDEHLEEVKEEVKEEVTVEEEEEEPIQVVEENSIVCDVGKGKKVIIRHLQEVADNANLEMSGKVSMEDWLVLNIEKDDWVVVGYSKVGGEIAQLYEQSVDTV